MEKIGGGGAGAAGSAGLASGAAGGVVWACAVVMAIQVAAIAGRRQFLIGTAISPVKQLNENIHGCVSTRHAKLEYSYTSNNCDYFW